MVKILLGDLQNLCLGDRHQHCFITVLAIAELIQIQRGQGIRVREITFWVRDLSSEERQFYQSRVGS